MPRLALTVVSLILLAFVVIFGGGQGIPATVAQEASPAAEELQGGVSFEPLAFGDIPALPPMPATFALVRLRLEPGATLDVPADDPGLALVYIESGSAVTYWVTVPTQALRGLLMATPDTDPFQQVPADIQITLGPGDSFVGPPNAGGGLRNDGLDEATVLLAIVQPAPTGTPVP